MTNGAEQADEEQDLPSPQQTDTETDDPLPRFEFPPEGPLGHVLRMQDVTATFGRRAQQFASERSGRGFALRLSDGQIGAAGQVDSVLLGDSLSRIGRAASWINNALFGARTVPGVEYAAAISSVVVQFIAPPEEELYREQERSVAPTAITGEWMAAMLVADEDEILEAVQKLRPRASGTYLKALEDLAERELSTDWLLLDRADPIRVAASRGQIIDTIEVLEKPVPTRSRTVRLRGIIYAADQYGHKFKMDVIEGELANRTITGTYGVAASESLEGAWRRSVDATIRIVEPEYPGMPRAPRTRYELVRVREIYEQPVPLDPPSLSGEQVQLLPLDDG
jgi:hypothetical protein